MDLLAKEVEAISFITRQIEDKNVAVSFSGGKDSLVALDLSLRSGVKKVVFSNTTIEFPGNLEFIKSIEDFYGIHIDIVKSPTNFFDAVEKVGFPSRRLRWCCDVFKFGPLTRYAVTNNLDCYITGLRHEESNNRANYFDIDKNKMVPTIQLNPLLDWDEETIWSYIRKYKLPINPLYKYLNRIGCWCCPYKTKEEWKITETHFPELMNKLEVHLNNFAEKIGIKDKHKFIKERKWTGWATPQSKVIVGTNSLCSPNNPNINNVVFFGKSEEQIIKISKLLKILTNDFYSTGKALRISVIIEKKKRLNTLIEKSINCIGCGACFGTCIAGALFIENNTISMDENLCTHCERCLHTQILKGACVVRNYAPKRRVITSYQ